MSNGLTLPFSASGDSLTLGGVGENAFSIALNSGGRSIIGEAYGTDPYGDSGVGISGQSDVGTGVFGASEQSIGVQGQSFHSDGVYGSGKNGVHGWSESPTDSGVWGDNTGGGPGVAGSSNTLDGVLGKGGRNGVHGVSSSSTDSGVWGENTGGGFGVAGSTTSANQAAVDAKNYAPFTGAVPSAIALSATSSGTGVYAQGNPAAYFQGDVQVTGDLILINSPASGDVAEDFDIDDHSSHTEPGTVLVIGSTGKLCASVDSYDTRVAGVVSGAGEFRPALVLQRIESSKRRSPIALIGKTFCKVDASFGSVAPGDLLTTSPTCGHAMKVRDRSQALGAILGKALASLEGGRGLIPILVSLR
jgi:hypothetical protein